MTKSIIACPKCEFKAEEEMPTDACQFFYECKSCKSLLKPLVGDCCVFCSYGSVPCPPIQQEKKCC
jgi:hypothetical protein